MQSTFCVPSYEGTGLLVFVHLQQPPQSLAAWFTPLSLHKIAPFSHEVIPPHCPVPHETVTYPSSFILSQSLSMPLHIISGAPGFTVASESLQSVGAHTPSASASFPALLGQMSQTLPIPSLSESSWFAFEMLAQLSHAFPTPSLSESSWFALFAAGQLSHSAYKLSLSWSSPKATHVTHCLNSVSASAVQ